MIVNDLRSILESANVSKASRNEQAGQSSGTATIASADTSTAVGTLDVASLPKGMPVKLLKELYLLRAYDELVSALCRRRQLPGLIHLGVGEEAVAVGTCAALRPGDNVTSTHRAHGHFLAKGADPKQFLAELYGKVDGSCRGKGGSMHLVDLSVGFLGANGVVGAGLPIAVGSALAQRIRKEESVTACFFGDGANNQGTFHESLNMAAVWDLPLIFVCENNGYGISSSVKDQQKIENVADRASSYVMPATIIDGNDVVAVYHAVSEAARVARSGGGPTLIECKTYRTIGHYEGDDQGYRPKEEVDAWRLKDPILRMEQALKKEKLASDDVFAALRAEVEANCEEAKAFAEASEFPASSAAFRDVFANEVHFSKVWES